MHQATHAVHTGVYVDGTFNSVSTPIYPSSTFTFDKLGQHRGFDYTRSGNPTRAALEQNLAALEGGTAAAITCTGMAAVMSTLMMFKPGDHIIAGSDIYGGTFRLLDDVFQSRGYKFSFIDMRDPKNVEAAITSDTKCIWIETPSNPLLNIVDIAAVAEVGKKHQLVTVADNTFLSPYFQQPLKLGVDIVVHSTTKYINGHSDVVGGAIITASAELAERFKYLVNAMGTPCSPFDAFLVLRGVKTLPVRMEAHQRNALMLAEFLAKHPKVKKVYYPGLDHPQKELIDRQQSGYGGMLSFNIDSSKVPDLDAFFARLKLFLLAESLGGVESLIEQPWSMSHASMHEKARVRSGITPETIRVSVGIEHPDDLIEDLKTALA